MINKLTLIALLILIPCVGLFARSEDQPRLYLSNYTFPASGGNIGMIKVRGRDANIKSVSIKGNNVGLQRKGKNFWLTERRRSENSAALWVDVVVKATTDAGVLTDTFRIVKDEFVHNSVIAHRGAWKNTGAAENSIASLQHAVQLGCAGSEFDVHMSADSLLFIHHDPKIDNTTIEKTPSGELSQIKLANGEPLPQLCSYLEEGMKQNKTRLILEIKASVISKERSISLTRKVLEEVRKYHAEGWVDYISFDYDVCKEVLHLAPYAKVSYLNGDRSPEELAKEHFYGLDYHYSVLQKHPEWIQMAKKNKVSVNVWTVNDESLMDWLLGEKVDFITTNEPELLFRKLGR